jgi:hypothetical protein
VARKYLAIYLQDHMAGAIGGLELARRSLSSNGGTELGSFLEGLVRELEEDRKTLEDLMRSLRVASSPLKNSAFWAAEKLGRLKLNGRLTGYSPLSRVIELEGLRTGAEAKGGMWRSLRALRKRIPELADVPVDRMIERAERQSSGLEEQRAAAAGQLVEP